MPGQCWSSVLRGRVATISCMPVQAGASRNHRSRPTQVPAQVGAPGANNCIAMETGDQIPLVGPGVSAQAWASRSGDHTAVETWNLMASHWVPAQAGASRSGDCTGWVARNYITMETWTRWTHHLPVAQTGTTRGSHGGVDGPLTKTRTRWSVGTHCPMPCLRAPRYHVDAGRTELWLALAFWRRAEWLKRVVRAAVAAATHRDRRGALITQCCRARLPQAA